MIDIKIDETTKELIQELKGDKKLTDDFIVWRALVNMRTEE